MPRRLLIVDDVASTRIVLKAKLCAAGFAVDLAQDVETALATMSNQLPDAALISSGLTDPDVPKLTRLLGARGALSRVPVILLERRANAAIPNSRADAIIQLPASDALILARLRSVLRVRDLEEELSLRASTCREMGLAEDTTPFEGARTIMLVPQSIEEGTQLADKLVVGQGTRIAVVPLAGLLEGLERRGEVDVVVIDANPDNPALDLHYLSDLRCRSETRHASIVLRLPANAQTEAAMALDLGASDVVIGSVGAPYLSACIRQQLDRQKKIRQLQRQVTDGLKLAVIDPLTGLYNRRYAINHLGRLVARSASTKRALAVMVLDIDRFKNVNDTFGHQNGDRVISAVANALQDNLRSADMVSRFGGEEFLVIMPDTSVEEATRAASRLCRRVETMKVELVEGNHVSVTLSIGLTVQIVRSEDSQTAAETMIRDADAALYAAKADGRNQFSLVGAAA